MIRLDHPGFVRRFFRAQAQFTFDHRQPFFPLPASMAAPMLEAGLNWCIGNYANQFLVIHSATLERGGRALLMPAPPGSGKSTLCAALVARGWRLLSDEFALVDPATGLLVPVPRPVALKDASIDVIARWAPDAVLGPSVVNNEGELVAYMRPPAGSVRDSGVTCRAGWIVVPQYVAGADDDSHADDPRASADAPRGQLVQLQLPRPSGIRAARRHRGPGALGDPSLLPSGRGRRCRRSPGADQPVVTLGARDRRGVDLLLAAVRSPQRMVAMSPLEWGALIPSAEEARLLPRLAADAERLGLTSGLPDWTRDRLTSALVRGHEFERAVKWEIDRVHRALLPVGLRPVFLKGAAYIAAGLPCGVGRVVADVDILVPEAELPRAQVALQQHGWEFEPLEPYDERYYREWMHELPPMRNRMRGTHAGRAPSDPSENRPDSSADRATAGRSQGSERNIGAVAGAHGAARGGAPVSGRRSGRRAAGRRGSAGSARAVRPAIPAFEGRLIGEAKALGLGRPLFYAVRYARLAGCTIDFAGAWLLAASAPLLCRDGSSRRANSHATGDDVWIARSIRALRPLALAEDACGLAAAAPHAKGDEELLVVEKQKGRALFALAPV